MVALVDVADSGTMEALYAKGFLTSENSNSLLRDKGPSLNATQPTQKGQNKHKDHIHRNGNYSASPHSEKESRKQKG